jgi:uncharacterized protein
MPTYLTPGVYVEEVPSSNKPIEGVGTAVAAFVGLAPGGPVNRPIRISTWNQFAKVYADPQKRENGPFMRGAYLAHAVHGFFANGGRVCWVARVKQEGRAARPDEVLRNGLGSLAEVDAITMISVPDLITLDRRTGDAPGRTLHGTLINECEASGARIAILDAPPDLPPHEIAEWRKSIPGSDSRSATLYYPWIEVMDPVSKRRRTVPPSGHVAGVWSRTASTAGIHRAPTDGAVLGARGLAFEVNEHEQQVLGEAGVNAIRSFPGRGIRVWGARTLSSDPEWRYVNVRRLFLYVQESIEKGTRWAMFEPNDEELWAQLRVSISNFLTRIWEDGGLFGSSPEDAFYVKCDEETNPPDIVEAGQVVVEVGIAPAKPDDAEEARRGKFVVFRVSHPTAAASEIDGYRKTRAAVPETTKAPASSL